MMDKAVVVWADGTYDINRTCVMCSSPKCSKPVYTERYKIKGIEQWEIDLTAEESEASGLSDSYQVASNWARTDAIDTLIAKENFAPEENEYAD